MLKILERLVLVAVFLVVLNLLGIDVIGWLDSLWDEIKDIPPGYMIGACIVQFGQTFFAGVSYYGILKYAYPAEVELWPIFAAYAVGVALNGFLPANLGTFVTLMMSIAIIPSCGFAGALGAYIVQKIFFTIAGTFVYLYMFLSVPARSTSASATSRRTLGCSSASSSAGSCSSTSSCGCSGEGSRRR